MKDYIQFNLLSRTELTGTVHDHLMLSKDNNVTKCGISINEKYKIIIYIF